MPGPLYNGNCNYTPISTLGTTTVNPGPAAAGQSFAGVFYGFNVLSTGTAGMGLAAYDIFTTVTGTGTVTSTNQLLAATTTGPGQVVSAAPGELGIRYRGSLVVVTTGTAGGVNALWD